MAFTSPRGRTQSSLSEINITPFVDVVLVLLIIFMLTAPILESGLVMETPKTRTVRHVPGKKWSSPLTRTRIIMSGTTWSTFTCWDRPSKSEWTAP